MKVEFLDSKKRKKLLEELRERFGINELPKVLFETGREKVRGFSGDLTIDELYSLDRLANIEFMGMYLFKEDLGVLRLGFDCALLLKEQVSKNVIELTKEQLERWMTGHNLDIVKERGLYIVKHGQDVFGCGLSDGKHLINFVPKERRIRRS
jgi:NOL1/NOP2/fmu family ribosome biogenesis protein